MENENQIIFWDCIGEAIVSVTGYAGFSADELQTIFDTEEIRRAIFLQTGSLVDNVSYEFSEEN